jgi:hypothetical protein
MDNVQNCDSYIDIPWPKTYISYVLVDNISLTICQYTFSIWSFCLGRYIAAHACCLRSRFELQLLHYSFNKHMYAERISRCVIWSWSWSSWSSVLVSNAHLGPMTRFLLLSYVWGFLAVGHPLWREDGSVIYSYDCFWILPVQSLSGPSTAEFMVLYYCLIWDSPNLDGQVSVFISLRNRVAQLHIPGTGFLFSLLLGFARLWRRYSNPPPHGNMSNILQYSQYIRGNQFNQFVSKCITNQFTYTAYMILN